MLQLESEDKALFRFSKESISLFHVFWPQVFIFLYYCYSIVISSGALKISIINIPVWILYNQWKYFVFSFQDYMFKLPQAAWENYTFLQFRLKTPRDCISCQLKGAAMLYSRVLLQRMKVKSESEVTQSCPTLHDPMDCSPPGSSSMGFSRQEYWSGAIAFSKGQWGTVATIRIMLVDPNERSMRHSHLDQRP